MMDNMSIETERIREITRNKCEQEHFENLRQLEEELEQKHIKQLESLAEMQQKHVRDIEAMKQKNENEKAKLTKELSKKFKEQQDKHAEEIDAVNLDLEKEIEKIKMELEAAHKRVSIKHRIAWKIRQHAASGVGKL